MYTDEQQLNKEKKKRQKEGKKKKKDYKKKKKKRYIGDRLSILDQFIYVKIKAILLLKQNFRRFC